MPRPPVPPLLVLGALALPLACGGGGRSRLQPAAQPAAPPTLAGFEPAQGYPGDLVTLAGQNLAGADQVTFGGVQSPTFTFDSQGRILATVPAGATPGPVTVRVRGAVARSTATFNALPAPPAPQVTGFTPDQGLPGTLVTLQGQGFTRATAVSFGGVPGEDLQILSDTRLTVRVPPAAAAGLITVHMPANVLGTSPVAFGVLAPPPVFATLSPLSGRPGDTLTLSGLWQGQVVQVTFPHGVAAPFTANPDGTLTVTVPPAADTGPLTVTNLAGAQVASPTPFTVLTDPAVPTGFSPVSGAPGDQVTLSGSNLAQVDAVFFGSLPALYHPTPDGAALRATVPLGAVTGPIRIQTSAGLIPVPGGDFSIPTPPITVTGLSATHAAAGASISILGTRLEAITEVRLGNTPAAFTPAAPGATRLDVVVPNGVPSGLWTVRGPGGDLPVPGLFTVDPDPAPVLTSASPATGVPGTEVTLTGQNLGAVTTVRYGSAVIDADHWQYDSGRIRLMIPDTAQTDAGLSVETEDGASIPLVGFTFHVEPSRVQALPRELRAYDLHAPGMDEVHERSYPANRLRSNLYGDLRIPAATVFHPLDPNPQASWLFREAIWSLDLALDPSFYPALPLSIRTKLADLAVPPANVAITVTTQNYGYQGDGFHGAEWLMRPHYWADAGAPREGDYNQVHDLQAGLYEAGSTLSFYPGVVGQATTVRRDSGGLYPIRIETASAAGGGPVLAGPQSEAMGGFLDLVGMSFWTLVVEAAGPGGVPPARAEASLHLFVTDNVQDRLSRACAAMNTLQDVRDAFCTTGGALYGFGTWRLFADLWRPLADPSATQVASPASDGTRVVTLRGTGMTAPHLNVILPDGSRLGSGQITVLSDACIEFAVPPGVTSVQLATLNASPSDPIPLP